MSLISRLLGWEESSFEEYEKAYALWGGSMLSNPAILQFLHQRFDLGERFFIKKDVADKIIGGVCVWKNNFIAGDKKIVHNLNINRYPLNFDEVILPIKPTDRVIIPFHTKNLSAVNADSVRNGSHLFNSKRQICIVRQTSAKTRSSRNRELKKFINDGGSVHNVSEYSQNEWVKLYADLFFMRRGRRPDEVFAEELISAVADLKFGHVLAFKGAPCAMQWIMKTEDNQRVYLDYVNAGMDLTLLHRSIGTLAAWVNVCAAQEYADAKQKKLRFSFGLPTADYKDRWCDREPLYRMVTC